MTGVYKHMSLAIVALVFRSYVLGDIGDETEEADQVRWKPLSTVESLVAPAHSIRILDAASLDTPAIRAHDGVSLIDPRRS